MTVSRFTSPFGFGEKVQIDGGDIIGTVVAACFYPHGGTVLVSWFNNGAHYEAWFADWRLTSKESCQ